MLLKPKLIAFALDKLSEKFSDDELDSIFKQKPEQIVKDTQFASKYCEKEIIK